MLSSTRLFTLDRVRNSMLLIGKCSDFNPEMKLTSKPRKLKFSTTQVPEDILSSLRKKTGYVRDYEIHKVDIFILLKFENKLNVVVIIKVVKYESKLCQLKRGQNVLKKNSSFLTKVCGLQYWVRGPVGSIHSWKGSQRILNRLHKLRYKMLTRRGRKMNNWSKLLTTIFSDSSIRHFSQPS